MKRVHAVLAFASLLSAPALAQGHRDNLPGLTNLCPMVAVNDGDTDPEMRRVVARNIQQAITDRLDKAMAGVTFACPGDAQLRVEANLVRLAGEGKGYTAVVSVVVPSLTHAGRTLRDVIVWQNSLQDYQNHWQDFSDATGSGYKRIAENLDLIVGQFLLREWHTAQAMQAMGLPGGVKPLPAPAPGSDVLASLDPRTAELLRLVVGYGFPTNAGIYF
ncbi:MAG TPA: hypothetical protein VNT60_05320, partial [Deinococcales bacterium]|nr:hypothetical protein [Deinococcales bacterium]